MPISLNNILRLWKLLSLFILFSLGACQVKETSSVDQTEPVLITETAVFTQTAEPTPVPTPFPKLEVTENLSNAVGSYSEEQLAVMGSEDFEEKVDVINYWAYAAEDQQPLLTELTDIHIVLFFDEENPESCSLAIEAKMDDGNWHIFLPPIDTSKGKFRQYPPVKFGSDGIPLEAKYDIPEGFGPLEVSGDIRWTKSGWVRLDEFGEMVEFLNMETGQWEEKKLAPTPEVTPEPEYEVLATNSIDTTVDTIYWNSQFPDDLKDYSQEYIGGEYDGLTYIDATGYLLSYEYGKINGNNFLNVLFVNSHGVIKVNVDVVLDAIETDINLYKSVDKMEDEDISKVLNWLDDYFFVAKEEGRIVDIVNKYTVYLTVQGLGNVNNIARCQSRSLIIKSPEVVCSFDPSLDTLSSEEMFKYLSDAFVPKKGLSISDILGKDYPIYYSQDNFYSILYLQQTKPGPEE